MRLKRLLAFVVAFAMVVGIMPTMSLTAFASTTVSTEAELISALTTGGEVVLGGNISTANMKTITVPAGVSATLDLGGKTLTFGTMSNISVKGALTVKNGAMSATFACITVDDANAHLTIEEGATLTSSAQAPVSANKGKLTVNGGEITCTGNNGTALLVTASEVEINGGLIKGSGCAIQTNNTAANISITNGTVEGNLNIVSGSVEITGGTFTTDADAISNYVTTGSVVTVAGTTYVKSEDGLTAAVAMIGTTPYSSLDAAVEAADTGDEIEVYADVANIPVITKAITIDGNGNNVTAKANENQFTKIEGTVTIKNFVFDNGTEAIRTDYGNYGAATDDYEGLDLVIEGCTFNNVTNYVIMGGSDTKKLKSLTVKGCTFNAAESGVNNYFVWAQQTGTLTVENNKFNGNGVTKGAVHTGEPTAVATTATISGNTIDGVARGVQVGNRVAGSTVAITDNTFTNIAVNANSSSKTGAVYVHENATADAKLTVTGNDVTGTQFMYNDNNTDITDIVTTFENNTLNGAAIYMDSTGNDTTTEPVVVPTGTTSPAYIADHNNGTVTMNRIWGQAAIKNATESFEVKIYSGETHIGTTTLVDNDKVLLHGGKQDVSWSLYTDGTTDEWWKQQWIVAPASNIVPDKVELYLDGTLVDTKGVVMDSPDNLASIILDKELTWADVVGVKKVVTGLEGSGTEEDPYLINNLDELKWFRDDVNTYTSDRSNQYVGKYVKLTADIDLYEEDADGNQISWTPIGQNSVNDHVSFMGTFDGDGHTISNLYVNQEGGNLGFFASVGSYSEAESATIKNLTFDNVDVSTTVTDHWTTGHGDGVGGVIGNGNGNTTITNVNVTGDVYVVGCGYVGGIVGTGYHKMSDCSVKTNAGSYINAYYWQVGALIGQAGEGSTISDCEVDGNVDNGEKNLSVYGAYGAAAAAVGLANDDEGQVCTLTNISVKNVDVTGGDYYSGYVAGNGNTANMSGITAENVTVGSNINATDAVATIGDAVYFDLQSAVNAAEEGDTVTVLRNVTNSKPVYVADGKNVVVDLNGKTIDTTDDFAPRNYAVFTVARGGELTINDSSENETGAINSGVAYAAVMMTTKEDTNTDGTAKLTVNGGTLTGSWYAVTGNGGRDNTDITINGGTLTSTSATGYAIYHPQQGTLTINGGTITAGTAVYMKSGSLNITDGTIEATRADAKDYYYVASGGVCTGDAVVIENVGGETGYQAIGTVSITGGTFTSASAAAVASYAATEEVADATVVTGFISGGTFSSDVTALCAEGYVAEEADGVYTVVEIPELPTATVSTIENEDLTFALNFKADEITETQLAYYGDWYADFVLTVNKDVTFNANGEADGYLAGSYEAYENGAWVNVPFEDVTLKAGESINIMEYAMKLMGYTTKLTYADVYETVKDFDCGVFFTPEFLAANPDFEVALELVMVNPEDEEESYVIGDTYNFYPLPTATVTEIANEDLTFALNFLADEVTEKQLAYYGDWAADFVLTVSDTVTFNANGEADGYLAGSYDAYENGAWVNVPFEDVTLEAGESINIMEYAMSLMGGSGMLTYKDVYNTVKDFDCGVFFTDLYLATHPEFEVTLELVVINPETKEAHTIGETYEYTAADANVKIDLPTATVTEIENEDLTFALNFKADEITETQLAYYGDWYADFVLTVNKDVTFNADSETADGYLAGSYEAYENGAWVNVPFEDVTLKAGESINIMEYAMKLMGYTTKLTYADVYETVKDFNCGVFFTPEFLADNPDFEVALELVMVNPEDEEESYVIGDTYNFYPVPTATVTEIENGDLTFALNFKADEVTEKQLAYYGDWAADYVLTINKDVTFNADSETADGYLSGQYDAWSENWVNVPFEDVTLKAGEPLKIMEYAAQMMGQPGLKVTYNDVYTSVQDFDCGVFFTDEFLAANPDLEVTLELVMVNPENEAISYTIGETYEYTAPAIKVTYADGSMEYFNNILDAVPYKTNYDALEGATIKLLADYTGSGIRFVEQNMTLDLNGKTYTINEGTGSSGSRTQAFQIRATAPNAKIMNGTIAIAEAAAMDETYGNIVWIFNNYATNFVVEDVTVDCTNMDYSYGENCYAIVAQAGSSVELTGKTEFENFDTATAGAPVYVESELTLDSEATLPGTIELGYEAATVTAGEGLDVVSAVDGYKVVYADGVYSLEAIEYVAEVNDVKYETLEEALKAAAENGDTVTLLVDLENTGTISIPAGVTLDGNNHKLSGKSSVFVGAIAGSEVTIKNLVTNVTGNAIWNENLEGKLTITNCKFEESGWDSIQITPVAGAEIVITDNTFEGSNKRYVHVQSSGGVDFSATVTGNKMYAEEGTTGLCPLDVYYFTDATKVNLGGNYIAEELVPNICILSKVSSLANLWEEAMPIMKEDLETELEIVAVIKDTYNAKIYTTLDAAIEAAAETDTITVLAPTVIESNTTIDFKNIKMEGDVYPIIRVQNGATVTVKNGNITNGDYIFVLGASDSSSAGNLTIESGNYVGETTVASVTMGTLKITGGTFAVDEVHKHVYTLNCVDANYKDGTAVIEVTGGSFYKFDPSNNAAEGTGTDYVPEGYVAEADGDYYTVSVANYVAQVGDDQYTTLQAAIDAVVETGAAGEVTLLADNEENVTVNAIGFATITLTTGEYSYTGTATLNDGAWIVSDEAIATAQGGTTPVAKGTDKDSTADSTKFGYVAIGLGVDMAPGASVRIAGGIDADKKVNNADTDGNGLRFTTQVDRNDTLAGGNTVGVKVTAESSTKATYVEAKLWQQEDALFTTAITNIPVSNFVRKYTAAAYVEVDGIKYLNETTVTRSIYQVAAGLLGEETQEAAVIDVLNAYVNQTGIRLVINDSELVANDSTLGKKGNYGADAFFTLSGATYDEANKIYTVTLKAVGDAKIYTHDVDGNPFWYDYVRINNNNSAVKTKIEVVEVVEDKEYTLSFYLNGLDAYESNDNTADDTIDDGYDKESTNP